MGRLWLCALLLAACESSTPEQRLRNASLDPIALERSAGGAVTLHARVLANTGSTTLTQASTFLSEHGAALGIDVARVVPLESGVDETVIYQCLIGKLPVFGARIHVHIADDAIVFVSARLPEDDRLATTTAAKTVDDAKAAIAATLDGDAAALAVREAELGVFRPSMFWVGRAGENRLAWRVHVDDENGGIVGYVDATSGERLLITPAAVTAFSTSIHDLAKGTKWTMPMTDANKLATELGPVRDPPDAKADALVPIFLGIHDWYFRTFGRLSWDGSDKPILSWVHLGPNHRCHPDPCPEHLTCDSDRRCRGSCIYPLKCPKGWLCEEGLCHPFDNGFWDPITQLFAFSDDFVTPSIVAHEFGHAIHELGSTNSGVGEPGAVREALADVMAAFQTGSWLIQFVSGSLVRNLYDPHLDGDPRPRKRSAYRDDKSIHWNSSIASYAMVLLTDGGTTTTQPEGTPRAPFVVEAIGKARAEQIVYRAIARKIVQGESTFEMLREALLAACKGLQGAPANAPIKLEHCGSILEAFAAVEVGERDRDRDTIVDSKDKCPDMFDPTNQCGPQDLGVPDLPSRSFPPCPDVFKTDAHGDWPLLGGSLGASTYYPSQQELMCAYAPLDRQTGGQWFYAHYVATPSPPYAHFSCWASTVPKPRDFCSSAKQASVQAATGGLNESDEGAAMARFSRELVTIVEPLAIDCPPPPATAGCSPAPIVCPPVLALPSVTMKLNPRSKQCPGAPGAQGISANCFYVGPGCAWNEVDATNLGNAPFSPSGPQFTAAWAETTPQGFTGPNLLACTGTTRAPYGTTAVVLYSPDRMAWVSYTWGTAESMSDRAVAEEAAAQLLGQIAPRALRCP